MTKSIMKRDDCKFLPLRLSDKKKRRIAKLAIDSNTSMNALINMAIDDFLNKQQTEESIPDDIRQWVKDVKDGTAEKAAYEERGRHDGYELGSNP